MTDPASFPGQALALAGAQRWDAAGGGDPIGNIQTALTNIWNGPGATRLVAYCSWDVWQVISRHPKILELFKYTQAGLATPQQVAGFFGLSEILIGKAWNDTANEGQPIAAARIWGKVFGIVRVAQNPGPRVACFGLTFRFGQKVTSQWYDPKVGMKGGYYAKVGLAEDHRAVATDTGYLLSNVIG